MSSFDSVDTNHDGFLSLEEFGISLPDVRAQDGRVDFATLDKNGDGRVSLEEWSKRAPAGQR